MKMIVVCALVESPSDATADVDRPGIDARTSVS